jgi:UDP-N-acetylmuramyl pentapeptide phosphotransferase/UDP-N-acetylglucosamine-1-phosphate transferase
MLSFALGFLVSLLITLFIVRYAHLHEKFSTDTDLAGVQKFHVRPVPRIGGTGILIGLVVSALQLSCPTAFLAWWRAASRHSGPG